MKNKILPVLFALVVIFTTNQASAYYSPTTGRWLSRDPMGEPGFELLRASSRVPRVGQVVSVASLPPSRLFVRDSAAAEKEPNRYAFVKNDPESKIDLFGLSSEPDVSWAPASCPNGQKTIFIQTLYGGWGSYGGPRVDDGGAGFLGGGSKGCPDYPSFGMPGVFQDSPSGSHGTFTGPVQFIVCRVCLKHCCPDEWQIASIGPCIYWKKGDKGDLSDSSTFTTVSGPPQTWWVALDQDYPTVSHGLCYKCLGNK
jgi:hypothetical protein